MKHFFSLSLHPGKTGEYYYSRMFAILRLPYTYTALKSVHVQSDISRLRESGAAGISISMPFKSQVINVLDHTHPFVRDFNSCNSIKIVDNELYGHNTDVAGCEYAISLFADDAKVAILGDGSMGSMFKAMLKDRATIYSRNTNNWEERYEANNVIINCTSFGTATEASPFDMVPECNLVIDLAIKETQLELQCYDQDIKYVKGIEFYRHQFKRQFKFYTGIDISISDITRMEKL